MPPSEASSAACGPQEAAPWLLVAAGARRARKKKLTRRQAGLLRGVQGPGRSRASTAGGRDGRKPRRVSGGGPEIPGRRVAEVRERDRWAWPGPRALRPAGRSLSGGGVARVPGGHPARGEGASGPDAASPSEGLAAARGSGRGPPEVIQPEVRVRADPGYSSEWRLLGNLQIFSLAK